MEEFLSDNYSLLIKSFEILAAVTGLVLYKKYKLTVAKFFIYYLIYVVFVEFIGSYPSYFYKYEFLDYNVIKDTVFQQNRWWYTLFWKIGATVFFAFYYLKILNNKLNKKILKITASLFILTSIYTILTNWNLFFIKSFPSISVFGALIIFLCAVFYFIEILGNEKILTFYKSINFYNSFVIFIWWLIATPLVFYDMYFTAAVRDFVILKWQIYLFANIFMYTAFTIGLIVSKPEGYKKVKLN